MKLKRQTYWNKQEIRKNRTISKLKIENYNLRRHPKNIGDIFAHEVNLTTMDILEIDISII